MKMKKRINRLLIGTLVCGMLLGMMLTVHADDGNTLPFVPFVPIENPNDTPDVPDIPEVPDTPKVPNKPEVSDTPEVPDIPEVPDTPDVPDKPNIPDVPETNKPKVDPEPSERTSSFEDVNEKDYYFHAVQWAVENSITSGTSATTFSPNASCTRAQAVTFLWRAAGSPEPESTKMPFTDVPTEAYYSKAVLWAVESGITMGTSSTAFSPDAECTRGQIVTFLWRSQKSPAVSGENPFSDADSQAYYSEAVLWAVKNGITSGTSATTFSPDTDCTRAQIVTFLYRCLGNEE